jgi:tetratricopeptide (TPR) repeat protein
MAKLPILLAVIVCTLSAIPVKARQVSFGYADNGLSFKGVPKAFVKPSQPSRSNKGSLGQSIESLKLRGIEAMGDLRYVEAVDCFKQAIASTNDLKQKAELQKYLFTALTVGGNAYNTVYPKIAIPMLMQAIAMQPKNSWLYARVGDAYCSSSQVAKCIEFHKIAIKLNPDKAEGVSRLAISLAYIDKPRSAKMFDLSAQMYREVGNMRQAEIMEISKSSFGLSGY